jgi:hypothetical protein
MNSNPNFPEFRVPQLQIPQIDTSALDRMHRDRREKEMEDHGYAHILYKQFIQQIRNFEKTLNPDEEIAAYLSSFGQTMLIQIEQVGYHNPFFIVFYGLNLHDGRRVQLVQHTTQLNVLFTSVKLNPEEDRPARRIGFCTEGAKV